MNRNTGTATKNVQGDYVRGKIKYPTPSSHSIFSDFPSQVYWFAATVPVFLEMQQIQVELIEEIIEKFDQRNMD